ncbi:HAMP domain-containing protein [Myxococcota bacterium]|nr:HAMP domain-containing protein [Myxococcota bacterium]
MSLLTAALLYVNYQSKLELIEVNKQTTLESLAKQFHSEVELTTKDAEARAELVANISLIKRLFRQGVNLRKGNDPAPTKAGEETKASQEAKAARAALLDQLHDTYVVQQERFGAVQSQFHRAPATSYYRLHDPKKWDDDLSSFRFTVLEANEKNRIFSGPEVGRGGLGIRGVVPVNDKEGQIGTFEFGLRFKPILERLKAAYGVEVSLLLDARVQKNITWEKWRDEAGEDIGAFKHVFSTDAARLASLLNAEALADASKEQVISAQASGKDFGVMLSPLKDFNGKRIGVIAIAKDFSEFERIAQNSLRNALILFAAGLFVLILLVFGLLSVTILGPIDQITRAADRVSLGDLESSMRLERKDEVGQLSESFERMRVSLSKAMQALEEE